MPESRPPDAAVGQRVGRLRARLVFARELRLAPWRVPRQVVERVSLDRPPEHVFEFFRRLHGIEDDN